MRNDPGCDRADSRVGEMREQVLQPSGPRHAVGVEEGDDLRGRRPQPGVARRPGTAVDRPADDTGAVLGRDALHGDRVGRSIVDHDHVLEIPQAGQASGELRMAVADG